MKKFIFVLSVISLVGCSAGSLDVDPDTSNVNVGDNTNVACVVGDIAWKCNTNTWTWDNGRSCSNTISCKNNDVCMLWDGVSVGVCKNQ